MRPTSLYLFFWLLCRNWCPAQPVIMYPGDANNDGVANQFDLLPVGIAFGTEGFPRQNASVNWQAQLQFPPWTAALPVSGINLGFVDCDGSGVIDTFDLNAIALNYDKTQTNSQPPPLPYPPKLTDTCFTCPKPDLVITFNKDTLQTNGLDADTLYATVVLRYPPGVPSQNGALGIAFDVTYNYDPEKIKDSLTEVYPDTFPDTRMYVIATSTKAQFWRLPPKGKMGFAAAGRGLNVFFISDTLFVTKFVIEDLIIRGEENFSLNISNVLLLNKLEQVVCLGAIKQVPVVITSPVSEPAKRRPLVLLSPNPAQDRLTLESPESPMEKISIYSPDGKKVMSSDAGRQQRFEIPVGDLPRGVWTIVVRTRDGETARKFVKR